MIPLDSKVCRNFDSAVTHVMSKGATSDFKALRRDELDDSQKGYYCQYGYR